MAEYVSFASSLVRLVGQANEEKKSLQLRALVHRLFFQEQVPKKMIARQLQVSRGFVRRWTSEAAQDLTLDERGWPKGQPRVWDATTIKRIKQIHQFLEHDPHQFFTGATAIAQEWRRRYPTAPPPLRTIGRVLAEHGLSGRRRTAKAKGAARYLCYPEHTIYHQLPGRVLEADFIGKKYLGGGEPLNFIGFSFKQPPKLRHFQYVPAQTADEIIKHSQRFFARFEKPNYLKVDNCGATIGSGSGQRTLSRFICFLLSEQVIPIFSVPRKPFSQASIEGNNSVFARKFWNRRIFASRADVRQQLDWFNVASERYSEYVRPAQERTRATFVPQIYFVRQVAADETGARSGFISILNEKISLPAAYINYFVLARWNLAQETLDIHFEKELKTISIKKLRFPINQNARYKKGSFLFGT
jgi:transposase